MSDPEYNAARRAKGLRAVTQGLNINLDLEVAIVCLNHAADKIEELERERDEALAYADKLAAGLPEGMLPKDVEVLRDANLALAVALEELNSINAERAAHRGTRKAWIELDDKRQILEKQLSAERALADRLGNALEKIPWTFAGREEQASEEWNALTAWKEARSE